MDGIKRTEEWVLPLESARARIAYKAWGVTGSTINNLCMSETFFILFLTSANSSIAFAVVIRGPNPFAPKQRVQVILVKENIGF